MIKLRKASMDEAGKILKFYQELIASIEGSEFKPRWSDKYPDLEYVETSILHEDLYVYEEDGDIVASFVVNNEFLIDYGDVNWIVDAGSDEIIILHVYGVNPNFSGNGIGKKIFDEIKKAALNRNKKSIRIDIINGNVGAQKVFEKLGFKYIDSLEMFYSSVGVETFHLYEYVL